MPISIRPVAAADIREFIEWRYPPPYDVYDHSGPYEEARAYFLLPSTACHAIDRDGALAGYCTFGEDARVPGGDYSAAALDLGMALRPDLTGGGLGREFVAAVVAFAEKASALPALRVSIAAANARALSVWSANGFAETQRFTADTEVLGSTRFVVLERRVDP